MAAQQQQQQQQRTSEAETQISKLLTQVRGGRGGERLRRRSRESFGKTRAAPPPRVLRALQQQQLLRRRTRRGGSCRASARPPLSSSASIRLQLLNTISLPNRTHNTGAQQIYEIEQGLAQLPGDAASQQLLQSRVAELARGMHALRGAAGALGAAPVPAPALAWVDAGGHPDDFVRETVRAAVRDNQVRDKDDEDAGSAGVGGETRRTGMERREARQQNGRAASDQHRSTFSPPTPTPHKTPLNDKSSDPMQQI